MKRRSGTPVSSLIQLGALALLACQSPSDVLYRVPDAPPLETVGGARLTTGVGPDVVRGFLSNGRVVFRTRGLLPGSVDWMVASIAPTGGGGQEEASVYRQAILGDVATLVEKYGRRVLGVWLPASSGIHGCPAPAPAVPGVVGVTFYEIGPVDGAPLSSLAVLSLSTGAVNGAGTAQQRVRVTPALREVETLGVNPFGPVLAPDGRIVYSDGETIWRARIGADQDREAITTGSFPALSADGRWLAAARPTGVDSTVQTFTTVAGLFVCTQEHVEITNVGWEVVLVDLQSLEQQTVGPGVEPVLDPTSSRVLVRRDALVWMTPGTTTTVVVPGTTGAFAPALSADGLQLAFSRQVDSNTDAYVLTPDR